MKDYQTYKFPKTRIASIDVCSVGKMKHHVYFLLELDVTNSREKIRGIKKLNHKISFTAWLLKTISESVKHHQAAGAYLLSKRKIIVFDDINISMVIEKELEETKVPIPLVLEKTNEKSIEDISNEIEDAKKEKFSEKDIVLKRKSKSIERLYYYLPAFIRRMIWRFMLNHPKIAFKKMGNIVVSSIGMMGRINGWFIQIAVHPISFGIGSIIKKPLVVNDVIEIREVLNLTILIDHDIIDGAPMARFINEFTENVEQGIGL